MANLFLSLQPERKTISMKEAGEYEVVMVTIPSHNDILS